MDPLDLRILRHMGWRPFELGPRGDEALRAPALARALGVAVDTVKARVRRMEGAGIIGGYEIHPNLRLLGLRQTTLHFRVPSERKGRVVEALAPHEGVACVYDFLEQDVCVDVFHAPGADFTRRVLGIEAVTGAKALRFYERPSPPTDLVMSRLDWRILRALRGRALTPLSEVADELRVSARTVKRRFTRMARRSAFDVGPILDPSRIESFIPVALTCRYAPGERAVASRLRRAFEDRLLYSWRPASPEIGDYELFVYARTAAEIPELRGRAAAVPGVASVESMLPVLVRPNALWVNDALDARIAAAPARGAVA